MKFHANRNVLTAIAGAALLLGSSAVSAKEGAGSLGDLQLQDMASMNYGDDVRSANIKSLFGATESRLLVCGDSEPDAGEECDDGNTVNGDGCSATCTIESGFVCSNAEAGISSSNEISDGSFELNDGSWTIGGWLAGRCDSLCSGGSNFASDGEFWIWVGGTGDTANTGSAVQTVTIPTNATTLTFDVLGAASGCGDSTVNVQIDGTPLWSYEDQGNGECNLANFVYEPVSIDITAFADGLSHTVTLFGDYVPAGGGLNANWFIDNFRLDVPLVPPIPPVPSACSAVVCGDGLQAGLDPNLNTNSAEACDDGNTTGGDGCSASCTVEEPGFVCDDAVLPAVTGNDVDDGGLEDGVGGPWTETGTQFEPICSDQFCGAALAADGAFFAWFGGSSMPNAQTLSQDVTISSTSTDLTFDLLIGICDSANDTLSIELNGTQIYNNPCTGDTAGYGPVSVDISGFAPGTYNLSFIGNTVATNGGNSNYFVDNIAINDNVAFAGEPSACFELPDACDTIEQFEGGAVPPGWTVINLGADAADGWGKTDDGICGSQNWTGGNVTGGGGEAACADSDATGQIDTDTTGTPLEMDTYLCTPALDLTQVTDPQYSFLVNYQSAQIDLNDNGTPTDTSDDFDDDFLEVLIGTNAPNALTVPNYDSLGQVFDHLDGSLAITDDQALAADLIGSNGESAAHVCFHYRGTYAWFAQIDNAGLRGSSCTAPPDADSDGVPDSIDNCTTLANASQLDTDGDGHGNRCDADLNQDCVVNPVDLGIFKTRFFTADPDADFDGSGVVNPVDLGILKSLFFMPVGPSPVGSLCNP